jgi:hypothetical protein
MIAKRIWKLTSLALSGGISLTVTHLGGLSIAFDGREAPQYTLDLPFPTSIHGAPQTGRANLEMSLDLLDASNAWASAPEGALVTATAGFKKVLEYGLMDTETCSVALTGVLRRDGQGDWSQGSAAKNRITIMGTQVPGTAPAVWSGG